MEKIQIYLRKEELDALRKVAMRGRGVALQHLSGKQYAKSC
jgi:hypothetical protein